MTKEQYLEELRRELVKRGVSGIDEIVAEYEEHFAFKAEEGQSEEETARRLSSPEEIADDYMETETPQKKGNRGAHIAGVVCMSIPLGMLYLLLWGSVAVLGAFSLASLAVGVCLIFRWNIAVLPAMPYLPSFLSGIACLALAVLASVGTLYLFLYVKQWGKAYFRWCRNIIYDLHAPALSKHPKMDKKRSFRLKTVAVFALACFLCMLAVAYITMCLMTKSAEPWHVWNWFQ